MKRESLTVTGMHCAGCTQSVEKAIARVEGVRQVSVNLASGTALVESEQETLPLDAIRKAVEQAGYSLEIPQGDRKDRLEARREREARQLATARRRVWQSWVLTAPIMIWMALDMFAGIHLTDHLTMEVLMTLGAGWVLFVPGLETLKSGYKSARAWMPNMDVLISIGTLASLITGGFAIAGGFGWIDFHMHSFAGIAAMIMAFHLTGRYIETRSRGRASEAMMKLLTLEAETANVIRNGVEEEVPVRELVRGDTVRIRPGEKVPADGDVIDGAGSLDESMITGESMPVRKEEGDEVIGGTINLEGSLRVQVTGIGEESFLNRVIELVEEAQGTKVPIQAYADRVTAFFVPAVLLLALLTFVVWAAFPVIFEPILGWADGRVPWVEPGMGRWSQAFFATLAVLVIACPCALGLATPVALMVGSGLGAGNGILIRQAGAIQRMQEVNTIVFDKTGTLTLGKPVLTELDPVGETESPGGGANKPADGSKRKALLRLLASVETPSEHPLARAARQAAEEETEGLAEVDSFRSWAGLGVTGTVEGKEVLAGNRRFLESREIPLEASVDSLVRERQESGKTVIFLVVDGRVSAIASFEDRIRPEAADVVRALADQGFETVMMTGDQQRAADAIARKTGIQTVHAEVMPDGKESRIRELQQTGRVVAMVGDGVNDAPALARADVGIAIGTGTDIAIEAGGIVVIDGHLGGVLKAVRLSRETFRKIRQNLFWAWFYNVVMIPVAVIGLMHPVLAEAAMAFSSINVIANSRRLPSRLPEFRNE